MSKKVFVIMFVFVIGFLGVSHALDVNLEKERLTTDSVKFTFGLGWAMNEFLGGTTRDGLGYYKDAFGMNALLGLTRTWIYGAPLKQEVINAIDEVVKENGDASKISEAELKSLVRKKLGDRSYTYFRFGTVYLLLPFVVQGGWMMPIGDACRFQFGLGLPLLLNVGVNFDF